MAGYSFIRRGKMFPHKVCMLSAFCCSALFLACYVYFHLHAGIIRFGGQGWIRPVYFTLLTTHTILAVVIVPLVLRRLLRGVGRDPGSPGWTDIAGSGALSLASTVLLAIAVAAFGFFAIAALGIRSPVLPAAALAISVAVALVAFVLMIMRRDVASQAIGFLSLENGISLAALVVAAGLPLILEVAFLFDLLVVVVVFGLLIRVHHGKAESMSTTGLTSLRG